MCPYKSAFLCLFLRNYAYTRIQYVASHISPLVITARGICIKANAIYYFLLMAVGIFCGTFFRFVSMRLQPQNRSLAYYYAQTCTTMKNFRTSSFVICIQNNKLCRCKKGDFVYVYNRHVLYYILFSFLHFLSLSL